MYEQIIHTPNKTKTQDITSDFIKYKNHACRGVLNTPKIKKQKRRGKLLFAQNKINLSEYDLKSSERNLKSSECNLKSSEYDLKSSECNLKLSEYDLKSSERDLNHFLYKN